MLFVSVLTYELGRVLGVEAAAREFTRQCTADTGEPRLPAAAVVAALRDMDDVQLFHPFGTRLPQLRSRCAHAALESEADTWVMVDDDVAADKRALEAMLAIVRSPDPPVVILPCLVRGTEAESHRVNVEWLGVVQQSIGGRIVQPVKRAGCGLMMVPRRLLARASALASPFRDDDGAVKRAVFQDVIDGDRWLGEDLSFCERIHTAGGDIVAPTEGTSYHSGMVLQLDFAKGNST